MARAKKNCKMVSYKFNEKMIQDIEDYAYKTKRTKTAILEMAFEEYMKRNPIAE